MSGLNDPHLASCPDYASKIYADSRRKLIETGMSEDRAIVFLGQLWRAENGEQKALWDQHIRLGAEKAVVYKTQFLPINQTLGLPDAPPRIPSAAVMATLRKGDYVPLYHFTNKALAELNESSELGLTLKDKSSLLPSTIRKPDAELNRIEFKEAADCMLALLIYAGWPLDRINMFRDFWANIQDHRFWERRSFDPSNLTPGNKALLIYQDEQRRRWHMLCASSPNSEVIYNLAILNETVLEKAKLAIEIQLAEAERQEWAEARMNAMAQEIKSEVSAELHRDVPQYFHKRRRGY